MAVMVVSRHVINLAAELVTDVLVSVVVAAGGHYACFPP